MIKSEETCHYFKMLYFLGNSSALRMARAELLHLIAFCLSPLFTKSHYFLKITTDET